jgi:hypothetical protein
MTTFYARVDGPALELIGRRFYGPIEIVSQPTYGRVLFRSHDIFVVGCTFLPEVA